MSILVPFHPLSTRSSYDRETRTLAGPKCPSGHTCKPNTFIDEHTCDGCGVDIDPADKGSRCTSCDFDLCIQCTSGVSDVAQIHERYAPEPVAPVPTALMILPGYYRLLAQPQFVLPLESTPASDIAPLAQPQFVLPLESTPASDIAPNFTVRNPSRMKLKPKPSLQQPVPEFDSIPDFEFAQTLSLPSPVQAQPQLLHPLNSTSSDIAPNFAAPNPSRLKLKPKPVSHLHARELTAQLVTDCHVLPILIVLIPTKHPIVCDDFFWC